VEQITALLERAQSGDEAAAAMLADQVYARLHSLAAHQRRRWRAGQTLDTTALVHEAWLKMIGEGRPTYASRRHFFAVATKAIRHILVNHAERRNALCRGAGAVHLPLDEELLVASSEHADTILAVATAVNRLRNKDEDLATLVEYRYFGGFTVQEVAEFMEQSPRTIKRRWQRAKAWLSVELEEGTPEAGA